MFPKHGSSGTFDQGMYGCHSLYFMVAQRIHALDIYKALLAQRVAPNVVSLNRVTISDVKKRTFGGI